VSGVEGRRENVMAEIRMVKDGSNGQLKFYQQGESQRIIA